MRSKIKIGLIITFVAISALLMPVATQAVSALTAPADNGGTTPTTKTCASNNALCSTSSCSGSTASDCIDCNVTACADEAAGSKTCQNDNSAKHSKCDIIADYVNPVIKLLTIIIGVVAVISIAFAGLQYSMAGGDPQKVAQAKSRIRWTIIALIIYAFFYGFIQFLIPGGAFH